MPLALSPVFTGTVSVCPDTVPSVATITAGDPPTDVNASDGTCSTLSRVLVVIAAVTVDPT